MIELSGRNQLVVPLLNNLELVVIDFQLEQGDLVAADELRRDSSASQSWILLRAPSSVLSGLHCRNLVAASLGLYWNDVVAPVLVEANVQLIYLDLSDALVNPK